MKRRDFLKATVTAPAAMSVLSAGVLGAEQEYQGRCLVTLQAAGGWDTASFCDPKENLPGEREITAWSRSNETRVAGNIPYAPYGTNAAFFEKYHRDMLVINGVDAQTNAHSVGEVINWTGRSSRGFPTLGALFASVNAPTAPLSYLNFGGVASTERLLRFTRLNNPRQLAEVLDPGAIFQSRFVNPVFMEQIEAAQAARAEATLARETTMPLHAYNTRAYLESLNTKGSLRRLADILPPQGAFPSPEAPTALAGASRLKASMMYSILSFRAGLSSAAGLWQPGFDTHNSHDGDHEPLLSFLTDALDFFWNYAEEQGVADRITLVVGSDFGRTPWYNSTGGKDHWPIGSYLIMEKGANWGNRVVGATDGGQNASRINPDSLQVVNSGGTLIYPKHVHKALRRYLGLEGNPILAPFQFPDAENFDFFNPNKSTA